MAAADQIMAAEVRISNQLSGSMHVCILQALPHDARPLMYCIDLVTVSCNAPSPDRLPLLLLLLLLQVVVAVVLTRGSSGEVPALAGSGSNSSSRDSGRMSTETGWEQSRRYLDNRETFQTIQSSRLSVVHTGRLCTIPVVGGLKTSCQWPDATRGMP